MGKEKGDRATVGASHVIGEMALIDNKPRAVSAIALEICVVMVISKSNFQDRLAKTDPVIVRLLNTFTNRLREQSQKVIDLLQ